MCLTEITCDIFVCVVGVWQREFLDLWYVCSALPDDGSQRIRNMSEFLIVF